MPTEIWKSWPQWLTNAAIAAYESGESPAAIGAVLGRQEGSVRAKLVRAGVYRSKAVTRKQRISESEQGF